MWHYPMKYDPSYFAPDIEKVRNLALNRTWTWPPERDAQIIFRTSIEPENVVSDAWAKILSRIALHHKIPLFVSGGGFGCFALAASCKIDHVERLAGALESDEKLHKHLDGTVDCIEVWSYRSEKTELDIVVPQEAYDIFLATKQDSAELSKSSSQISKLQIADSGKLVLGTMKLWVYDPRTSSKSPGIVRRIWRRLFGGVQSLNRFEISHSNLNIVDPSKVHNELRSNRGVENAKFAIFVHGFATKTEDAIQSYGRLAHNIRCTQIGVTPVIFSWPSAGSALQYTSDVSKAEGSEEALNEVLNVFVGTGRTKSTVDILAHSHGTKLTVRSLTSASCQLQKDQNRAPLRNIVLIAPDVDNEFFQNKYQWVRGKSKRITVYHSKGDLALWLSALFQTPRIGQPPNLPKLADHEMDLIDTSFLRSDYRGHSYHTECPELHEDLRGILEDIEPEQRRLLQRDNSNPKLWRIAPVR